MPKALTHLCQKVNLSLFNDTLTVYPKSTGPKKQIVVRNEFELLMAVLFMQMDCASAEIDKFFMTKDTELGVYRFVHRNDIDHGLYHQDEFDMEDNHYHAQFDKTIDDKKLDSICVILEREGIISADEHASFVKAFKEANTLPAPTNPLTAKKDPVVVDKLVSAPTTFGGFKPGFFYSQSSSSQKSAVVVQPSSGQKSADVVQPSSGLQFNG